MPPRHTYWTIIYGNQPTAFRSATRDELLPTLRQLQSKHPDAIMMWFARGRLWTSPEEAREALERRRARPGAPRFGDRPPGPRAGERPTGPRTGERPTGPRAQERPTGPRIGNRPTGPRMGHRPTAPSTGDRPTGPRAGDRPAYKDRDKPHWRDRPANREAERTGERRGRDWRPGGAHKDPRDRFKVPRDVKRQRFADRLRRNVASPKPPNKKPHKKKDGDE